LHTSLCIFHIFLSPDSALLSSTGSRNICY
jgi:hypothetical protein